jgi:hypothetical protein
MRNITKKQIYEYVKLLDNKGVSKNTAFKNLFGEEFDNNTHKYILQLDNLWEISKRIDFINSFNWEKACNRTVFETKDVKILVLKELMIRFVLSNDTSAPKLSGEICKILSLYEDNSEIKNALETIHIQFKDLI